MNKQEYIKMENLEKTYWWHRGRLFLIENLIKRYFPTKSELKMFEIGCGTGQEIEFLNQFGEAWGMDVSDMAVDFCKAKGLKNVFKADIVEMDITKYKHKYDAVFALDVLEHVQEDVTMMKKANELLKKDGVFIATVPAHKFLWSEHDEALHHRRRYHSLELTQKLEDSGFEVLKKTYFVMSAFFPIVFFRMWGNVFGKSAYPKTSYVMLPEKVNNLLVFILKVEAYLATKFKLPIGTSLVIVAKPRR